ncbi:MAG: CRISPR-associated protein Cas4, partial [Firmicutes bacterium]|nr:CRISPR-associated protein Cas4 [Bacillota bacterium]
MYFLSDEERKHLLKRLLPKSRELEVAEELRGWNWHTPPLEPAYGCRLALYEVAGSYCPTNRDLFLRRVAKARAKPNAAMVRGAALHAALVHVLVSAKRLIYRYGVERHDEICRELQALDPPPPGLGVRDLSPEEQADLAQKTALLT